MTKIIHDIFDLDDLLLEDLTEEEFKEHLEFGFDGQEQPDFEYHYNGTKTEQWDNMFGVGLLRITHDGVVGYAHYE
jgi:hypothetical protein